MVKPEDLKLNDVVKTNDIIPEMEVLMGEQMKFVGRSYHFVGDSGILQSINVYAEGFDIKDYED